MTGPGWDFFVSYTQADRGWAEWIAWQLEIDEHSVLIQAWDMVAGTNWVRIMQDGARQARRTIVVLSAAYLESEFATAEFLACLRSDPLGRQRKLLVFRVANCDRPGLLAGVVSTDLIGVTRTAARELIRSAVRDAVTGRAKPENEPDFPPAEPPQPAEPRFPGVAPVAWNVPLRNPNFAGRVAELHLIQTGLAGHQAVTIHALRGMGGIGKTQTAIEYAHRNAGDYDLVWWINAEQAALIGGQLASLAEEIGLPQLPDPAAMLRAVHRTLCARARWLLIFDNAENAEEIRPLLPGGAGHVLITTRRSGFGAVGSVLDLDTLDRADAITLLRRRAPALTGAQADSLAVRLGDLPLALDQAAAYLHETGMRPDLYLELLSTRSTDLHGRGQASGYPGTVATVWAVSFGRLDATAPAAAQLLKLCAWLAPEPIPLDLFTTHADLLPEPLAATAADPVAFNDAVGALADYSLARRVADTITVHRLVQDVTRHLPPGQPAAAQVAWHETVLALLRADLPSEIWASPQNWPRWRALLPSVLAAAGHSDTTAQANAATAWLLDHAGIFLRSEGRYAAALHLLKRALCIHQATLGPDHTNVAATLNQMGRALTSLSRYASALPLHQRALDIDEAALGPNHPDVATGLNYVGHALAGLGRYEEALPLQERALRIREAALGPDHPYVAIDLNYVGRALAGLGRARRSPAPAPAGAGHRQGCPPTRPPRRRHHSQRGRARAGMPGPGTPKPYPCTSRHCASAKQPSDRTTPTWPLPLSTSRRHWKA